MDDVKGRVPLSSDRADLRPRPSVDLLTMWILACLAEFLVGVVFEALFGNVVERLCERWAERSTGFDRVPRRKGLS